MGLRSEGDLVRGQLDTVGYAWTAAGAEDLLRAVAEVEQGVGSEAHARPATGAGPWIGGICPHDDHLYSARTALRLIDGVEAPRVILIGVFHKARLWQERDRLVFDSFTAWHGPWGPVPVDGLRRELLERLDASSYVVDNAIHEREHSLEGLVPLLQHHQPEVSIVPILVPYMGWDRIEQLAGELAAALHEVMQEQGWQLGRDVAVVVSNDAVHYGPDFDHAPFGTGVEGYAAAVARDRALIHDHLEGELRAGSLQALQGELVDVDDVRVYRIPWCGRFSVPFGLELLRRTAALQGRPTPEGTLLRYATSLSDPEPPVAASSRAAGLGTTAPSNLHHWVGFFALGVR
jgi:AmmeMemoRadiSam system protein B